MKFRNLDIEERIFYLSMEIKFLTEENKLSKKVIIDDFTDLIMSEIVEIEK